MPDQTMFAGLVLAAGKGTRFPSEPSAPVPKVLRKALGRPLVSYAVEALRESGIDDITVVVGFGAEQVRSALGDSVRYAVQEEQNGSGGAAACAGETLKGFTGHLIVMCGDCPLFTAAAVRSVMKVHVETKAAVTLASSRLEDPYGYGRILRGHDGRILGVVEEKCAQSTQKSITEVNGGIYGFDCRWLYSNVHLIERNAAGEYNLTDMVRVAVEQGLRVSTAECDPHEILGVNTPDDLKMAEDILRSRCQGMTVRKKKIHLPDGRYLIYYSFEEESSVRSQDCKDAREHVGDVGGRGRCRR